MASFLKIADPDKPGDYLVIASGSFDPTIHTLFAEESPASSEPAPAPAADPVAPLPGTAAELVTAIASMDAAALDIAAAVEGTREGGPRKTVTAAIDKRRAQIAA